ncbi:MAG: PaaI family thioesterase [Bdellovibrionota bacterium]
MPERFEESQKKYLFRSKGCFGCGTENESSMGIQLYRVGDKVYGDYVVPFRFRGLSKAAHGGIVCCLLDEVTVSGMAFLLDEMCVTTQLTVRFKKPLPLEEPVQLRSWLVSRDGRKVVSKGEIVNQADQIIADCDADIFVLDPEKAKKFLRNDSAEKMKDLGKGRD